MAAVVSRLLAALLLPLAPRLTPSCTTPVHGFRDCLLKGVPDIRDGCVRAARADVAARADESGGDQLRSARYDSRVHTLKRRGSVPPDDLAASLGDYVVIDVRDRSQFELGHIPGSAHVPIDQLHAGWGLSDVRLPVAVLGEGDADAEAAVVLLMEHGSDAITISGGAWAWRAARQCFVTNRL
jgi:rhodanese-related sulfurtransferase